MQRYFSIIILVMCSLVCAMENPLSPKLLQILKKSGPVKAASFTPSGHRLAVGGMHPELIIYMEDGDDDDKLLSIAHCDTRSSVLCIDASPNSGEFAAGTFDGKIILHDTFNGSQNEVLATDALVNSVQYSKSGLHLLAACNDKCRIWDLLSKTISRTFSDHACSVLNAQFNPSDNTQIASCSAKSNSIYIWDLRQKSATTAINFDPSVCRVAYNNAGTKLMIAQADQFMVFDPRNTAKAFAIYDVLGKKISKEIYPSKDKHMTRAIQFLPDQGDAFFAGLDGAITFCDLNKDDNSFSFRNDTVNAITIHADTLATGSWAGSCIKIWDIKALTAKIKKEIK